MRTTLKDIAERVGVTKALVSLYLNNHPLSAKIAQSTKEKIDQAVRELNYRPSSMARALKSGRSRTFGLVIGDICSDYAGFLAQSPLNECAEHDYQLLIGITRYNPEEERRCLENLIARQADGIFFGMGVFPAEYLESAGLRDYPLLQLHSRHPAFNAILRKEGECLKTAVRHLRDSGCRSLVVSSGTEWSETVRNASAACGIDCSCVHLNYFSTAEDFNRIRDRRPDAVALNSSTFASALLASYAEGNVRELPQLFYSYTLPCDLIASPCVAGVVTSDFKMFVQQAVKRMIEMQENPGVTICQTEIPATFLTGEQMRQRAAEQLKDPFYAPFTMKMRYKQREV